MKNSGKSTKKSKFRNCNIDSKIIEIANLERALGQKQLQKRNAIISPISLSCSIVGAF